MMHSRSLHYPSGYPMTQSPPIFVCSSPGPDPYRSHDNIYEELAPIDDESDEESDSASHSEEDFAEDELSLHEERNSSHQPKQQISTIYHQSVAIDCDLQAKGRNSLISTSSSNNQSFNCNATKTLSCLDRKLFRDYRINPQHNSLVKFKQCIDDGVCPTIDYTRTKSLVSNNKLGNRKFVCNYEHNCKNNKSGNVSNSSCRGGGNPTINYFTYVGEESSDVAALNQFNNRLTQNPVSTIFREQIASSAACSKHNTFFSQTNTMINPQSLDRRRHDGYRAAPPYSDDIPYDGSGDGKLQTNTQKCLYPYIIPEFNRFRNMATTRKADNSNYQHTQHLLQPICSRDSSFGSDSGYSHHTQTSSITVMDEDGVPYSEKEVGASSNASRYGCSWSRRKHNSENDS